MIKMLLDKLLLDKISIIGKDILNKCELKSAPQNIDEMCTFLNYLNESSELPIV